MRSRRNFLQTCATGALTIPWLHSRLAAAEPPALQLGLVTYNWGKEWDIEALIRNCEATGFAGVELRSTHQHGVEITLSETQRRQVRERFAESPVTLVGLGSACEYHSPDAKVLQQNIEETQEFVKLCHAVGGSGVKVRPNGLPQDVPEDRTIEQIGRALNRVGKFAADFDVQIRVEVHGRETAEIPRMKAIMDVADHPNVVVCWNCNPQDLHGAGLKANYGLLADRMGTIHIHDLRKDNYPWAELFSLLQSTTAATFTGWTLLEEGQVPDDIIGAMKENRLLWDKLIKSNSS